jgi:predicted Zn-dependent protease
MWKDQEIDMLQPVPSKGGWLLVRDLAVRHILRENKWRQPIYFAVTIPPSTYAPYREYLEMQGLVYLLVQTKGSNMINEQLVEENIYNQFSYRSILTEDWKRDESVFLPAHTKHLIQNYAAAFIQLGYLQQEDAEKGLRSFQIANEIAPQMEPVKQLLGRFYFMAGDTQKAVQIYDDMIRKYPDNPAILYRAAEIYERMGNYDRAIDYLNEVLRIDPTDRQTMLNAYGVSVRANRLSQARNYLVRWLNAHPDDQEVRQRLAEFDAAVKAVPANPQPKPDKE